MGKNELALLSAGKTFNLYQKKQVIFYEGGQPQGLYCIYSGKVKIHKIRDDGKEQIVRLAKDGSVIGYRSLLVSDNYHATATTLEDTMVCFFPKSVYMEILMNNPLFYIKAIQTLSSDLRFAEEMIVNMAQKPVRARMAEAILLLKENFGVEDDNATINTVMKREDIGSIAGTTTETSIRILSDFNKKKFIKLVGKKIKILEQNKLQRISQLSG